MSRYIPFSCLFHCPFKEEDIILFVRYVLIYSEYIEGVPECIDDIELVPIEGRLEPHIFEYKKGKHLFVELPEGWDLRFHNVIRKDRHKKRHFLMNFIEYITKNIKEMTLLKKIMERFNQEEFVLRWKKRKCKQCQVTKYNKEQFKKEGMEELINEFGQIDLKEEIAVRSIRRYWEEWQPVLHQTNKNRGMILRVFHDMIRKHIKSIELILLTGDRQLYRNKVREIQKCFENDMISKVKFLKMKDMRWDSVIYTYMQCHMYKIENTLDEREDHVILYYLLQILYICYSQSLTTDENDTFFIYLKNGKTRKQKINKRYHDTHPLLRGLLVQ